jgi:hypothetical protein
MEGLREKRQRKHSRGLTAIILVINLKVAAKIALI